MARVGHQQSKASANRSEDLLGAADLVRVSVFAVSETAAEIARLAGDSPGREGRRLRPRRGAQLGRQLTR